MRSEVTQVTEPVAKIQHDANSYTAIYILRDNTQKFRMPGVKDDSPRAWDYGPSLIVERISPQGNNTVTHYPDEKTIWKWLGALIAIGAYAMNNEELASKLPAELKNYWAA
jgi:hypothetical protein